jgi:hypothetical protein
MLPVDAHAHLANIIIACGGRPLEGKWTAQVAVNSHIPPIDPVTGRSLTLGVRKDVYIVSLASLPDVLLVNRYVPYGKTNMLNSWKDHSVYYYMSVKYITVS